MVKNLPASVGDTRDEGLIPGLGRSLRAENDNSLQYSCLENSMDRGAWWAIVYGATKSQTRLRDYTHTPDDLYAHHEKRWTGRSTSWNQDCWEKYQ